jgi:predicted acetylornithine/succinylornithine family transaminase
MPAVDATPELLARADAVLMPNYGRVADRVIARGRGSLVWDVAGREYLDLFAGFGGAILGHCHPQLVEAVCNQAKTLWHVGNQFHTKAQIGLAEKIRAHSFDGQAFFCHGGADANETALKAARLRHGGRRWKTIVLGRAFHGRTFAALEATANEAYKEGFGPMMPGFVRVEPGDLEALKSAIDGETAAMLMEPMQGEGGMFPLTAEFGQAVRALCDEHELTLICDEVWTGCGRTGKWFAFERLGIRPDIFTLGKALGGGLPVGACWARPEIAQLMQPGKHGSTLGGNPLCATAARTVLQIIETDDLVEKARRQGETLVARLRELPGVAEVRGSGLFVGFEGPTLPKDLARRGLDAGLILNQTGTGVVRLAPALTIDDDELDAGLRRLEHLLKEAA